LLCGDFFKTYNKVKKQADGIFENAMRNKYGDDFDPETFDADFFSCPHPQGIDADNSLPNTKQNALIFKELETEILEQANKLGELEKMQVILADDKICKKFLEYYEVSGGKVAPARIRMYYNETKVGVAVETKKKQDLIVPSFQHKILKLEDIDEKLIKEALSSAQLQTTQSGVSLPAIRRYYQMLVDGKTPPPIQVTKEGVIIEGNHRYVAGMLFGKIPESVLNNQANASKKIINWSNLDISQKDWLNK
jgi:hypothetical protein